MQSSLSSDDSYPRLVNQQSPFQVRVHTSESNIIFLCVSTLHPCMSVAHPCASFSPEGAPGCLHLRRWKEQLST